MIELKENIKYFLKNKIFITLLIIVTIMSYGFAITHNGVGVDDLGSNRYVTGPYILSANRWGTWSVYNILRIIEFTPFWLELVTVLIYMATAILSCAIIKTIAKDKISNIAYIIFSFMYISYPVLFEPLKYQPTNLTVALSNMILILMAYFIYNNYFNNNKLKNYIIYGLISSFAIAMYESCVQTYIIFVFMLLFLHFKYVDNEIKFIQIIKLGLAYIAVLIIGMSIYMIIGAAFKMYLKANNLLVENFAYHKTVKSFGIILDKINFFKYFEKIDYILGAFKYLSIVFIISGLYELIRTKKWQYIFFSFMTLLSSLIFFFIFEAVLFRMYYAWAILIAFEAMYIFEVLRNIPVKNIDKFLTFIFMFIIIIQTKETNQKAYENYRIEEMSKNTALVVTNTIMAECEDYKNKPLIYKDVEFINEKESDMIYWGYNSFGEIGTELTKYINHFGYNFENASQEVYDNLDEYTAEDYAKSIKHNNYVSEGEKYIYITINY